MVIASLRIAYRNLQNTVRREEIARVFIDKLLYSCYLKVPNFFVTAEAYNGRLFTN